MATRVTTKAMAATTAVTMTRRSGEKGSRKWPAVVAVMMKPTIIISQTVVAAAARRRSLTRLASSTSREVPQAPTPTPIRVKARMARRVPPSTCVAIKAVALLARTPPMASRPMPPMIQGVRRPPTSEP